MAELDNKSVDLVEVVAYNANWPVIYQNERDLLIKATHGQFINIEHIGSTAIPGQQAKPIIDIMASVESLQTSHVLQDKRGCPRQESNLCTRFRKPLLYPLSYGGGWLNQAV